ncbi:hypothetical protein F4860DRAFT_479585 [Xylaria cubensis]|nr:hypothetical protein F4860DRAFT_479585 [Xylaria cubensis]
MDKRYVPIACAIVVGIVFLGAGNACFSFVSSKFHQRKKNRYQGEITTLVDPGGARFEIVAVHGLAANPRFTWGKNPKGRIKTVDLLENILKNDFQEARILSFTHNSDWLFDAPIQSAPAIGQILLDQLIEERQNRSKLPIIFIGHSFGGIIIKQALCASKPEQDISENTRGIIFLGTPHQGTEISDWGALLASLTNFLGSDNTLLLSLKRDDQNLSDLETGFRKWIYGRPREVKVECFYEIRPTLIFGKLSIGLVVSRNSATGMAIEAQQMNTNHTGMTKFWGSEDKQYKRLKDTINKLIPSDEEYEYIREKIYTEDKLRIERLSKQTLAIDQCYINLAIVTQFKDAQLEKHKSDDTAYQSLPFSRSSRLKIETPTEERQVELSALFDSRQMRDGSRRDPRRILIRGNAGIGKTTLCKKIVHDFTHGIIWEGLFDRILWVQLRELKKLKLNGSLYDMFRYIYFWDYHSAVHAGSLWEFMRDEEYRSKSIFILDGLDEVVDLFSESQLLVDLLKMPSVIITTRPHVVIPSEVQEIDLELETIGFYPNQVQRYIEKVVDDTAKAGEIRSFLQKHWLLESLVRIPIQLDALCLIWGQGFENDPIPETMTGIYKAICNYLWRKDIGQLGIIEPHKTSGVDSTDVRHYAKPEMEFVELLAFSGLRDNTFEFDAKYRACISDLVGRHERYVVPFGELPGRLSFLRTSETSKIAAKQSYHFLHLTFQEFFAAQYFVKQWEAGEDLKYMGFDSRKGKPLNITPEAFLQKNKYNTRYEIVWRFTAGLLHGQALADFFREIEHRSPDYLGPVHQRLVMHCFSEVNASEDLRIRSDFETRLSRWLLFQCDLTRCLLLAGENEFPDTVLRKALREGSDSQKLCILKSLDHSERYLSRAIITHLDELLECADLEVNKCTLGILRNHSNLPSEILNHVLSILKEPKEEIPTTIIRRDIVWMAAHVMGNQSILPMEIITALVELIVEDNASSTYVADALGKQSNLGDENIIRLVKSLEEMGSEDESDENYYVPWSSPTDIGRALSETLSFPGKAVEILEKLLESPSYFVQHIAITLLRRQSKFSEKTAMAFIRVFKKDDNPDMATSAFRVLINHRNLPERAVEALVQTLQDGPWHRRHNAAIILAHQSNLSLETKTVLKMLTEDSNAGTQYIAALALKEQSSLPQQTFEALLQELKNNDHGHPQHAIEVLRRHSSISEQIITALVALLKNADVKTSQNATEILKWHPNLKESIRETLVGLLEDRNSNLRDNAAEVLEKQSSLPQKTIETLLSLLNNKNSGIRLAAARILGGQSRLLKSDMILVEKLCNLTTSRQDIIAGALGRESNLSKEAIAVLTQLLEWKDTGYQEAAVLALTGQPNLPEETIGILMTLLERGELIVQNRVSDILTNQTTLSDKHGATVISLFRNTGRHYRYFYSQTLLKRSDWSDNIALKLVKHLVDMEDYTLPTTVAIILGNQSKLSMKIATHCVELLQHADIEVRYKVARAIGGEPILVDKIIEALGFASESKASAGDATSSANTSQTMKALYGAFLCCSFEQQFSLQVNKDSTLTINHPNGSWTIHLNDPISEINEWRRFWGFHDYEIPFPLEEPEPTLEEV